MVIMMNLNLVRIAKRIEWSQTVLLHQAVPLASKSAGSVRKLARLAQMQKLQTKTISRFHSIGSIFSRGAQVQASFFALQLAEADRLLILPPTQPTKPDRRDRSCLLSQTSSGFLRAESCWRRMMNALVSATCAISSIKHPFDRLLTTTTTSSELATSFADLQVATR